MSDILDIEILSPKISNPSSPISITEKAVLEVHKIMEQNKILVIMV